MRDKDCYREERNASIAEKIGSWVKVANLGLQYLSGLRGVTEKVNFRQVCLEIRVDFSMDSSCIPNHRSSMCLIFKKL